MAGYFEGSFFLGGRRGQFQELIQYFEIANQIYDKIISQAIRYMEMNSSNLTS